MVVGRILGLCGAKVANLHQRRVHNDAVARGLAGVRNQPHKAATHQVLVHALAVGEEAHGAGNIGAHGHLCCVAEGRGCPVGCEELLEVDGSGGAEDHQLGRLGRDDSDELEQVGMIDLAQRLHLAEERSSELCSNIRGELLDQDVFGLLRAFVAQQLALENGSERPYADNSLVREVQILERNFQLVALDGILDNLRVLVTADPGARHKAGTGCLERRHHVRLSLAASTAHGAACCQRVRRSE